MDRDEIARRAFHDGLRKSGQTAPPKIILPGQEGEGGGGEPLRVAIVVPSTDMVYANFAMALAFMMHVTRGIQLPLINVKGSNVARQRNNGVAQAQLHNCHYVLMVDSDMTFPPNALARLLHHDKDIVGATYARRCVPHDNLARPKGGERTEVAAGLTEVDGLPGGFLLVKTSVFEKLTRPYFRWGVIEEGETREDGLKGPYLPGEDYEFCNAARAAGFSIWVDVDLSYELIHWGEHGVKLAVGPTEANPTALGYELVELEGTPS